MKQLSEFLNESLILEAKYNQNSLTQEKIKSKVFSSKEEMINTVGDAVDFEKRNIDPDKLKTEDPKSIIIPNLVYLTKINPDDKELEFKWKFGQRTGDAKIKSYKKEELKHSVGFGYLYKEGEKINFYCLGNGNVNNHNDWSLRHVLHGNLLNDADKAIDWYGIVYKDMKNGSIEDGKIIFKGLDRKFTVFDNPNGISKFVKKAIKEINDKRDELYYDYINNQDNEDE